MRMSSDKTWRRRNQIPFAVSFREHQGSWSRGFVDHKYQADEDGSTSRKEAIMLESVEETEESVCMWIHG